MGMNQGTDVDVHGMMHHRFGGKMSIDRLQKVRATVVLMKDQMFLVHGMAVMIWVIRLPFT